MQQDIQRDSEKLMANDDIWICVMDSGCEHGIMNEDLIRSAEIVT